MNLIHYNINITCVHIGGLIQADWHVLIRNIGLKFKKPVNLFLKTVGYPKTDRF